MGGTHRPTDAPSGKCFGKAFGYRFVGFSCEGRFHELFGYFFPRPGALIDLPTKGDNGAAIAMLHVKGEVVIDFQAPGPTGRPSQIIVKRCRR